MLNGASARPNSSISARLIKPVRGLNKTVQETASITGGKIFGTIAVSSKKFLNGALVRIEIHASEAAKKVATSAEPVANKNELKSSSYVSGSVYALI